MTEEERVRATARRVGLDVPITYDGSEEGRNPQKIAQAQALARGDVHQEVRRPSFGPLKPPV